MKKKETFVVCLGVLFVSCYVIGYIVTESSRLSEVVTTITAIIGAIAIWYQLKKDRELNEATFIMNYNTSFIENKELTNIEAKLDKYRFTGKFELEEEEKQSLVNYLVYIEALAALVFRKVISLESIDDLFSYRFFLAMHNPVVQQTELFPEAEFYRGSFKLYKIWIAYKQDNNLPIVLYEHRIEELFEHYEKYSN